MFGGLKEERNKLIELSKTIQNTNGNFRKELEIIGGKKPSQYICYEKFNQQKFNSMKNSW